MKKISYCLLLAVLSVCKTSLAQSPMIVAQLSFLNQTTPVPPTPLVTPTGNAFYRVSVYAEVTKTDQTGSSMCITFGWTDNVTERSQVVKVWTSPEAGPQWAYSTILTQVIGGQPLTYSGQKCGGEQAEPMDVFITVEQLM